MCVKCDFARSRFLFLLIALPLFVGFTLLAAPESNDLLLQKSSYFQQLKDDFNIRYNLASFTKFRASVDSTMFNDKIVYFLKLKAIAGAQNVNDEFEKINCYGGQNDDYFLQKMAETRNYYSKSMQCIWDNDDLDWNYIWSRISRAQGLFEDLRTAPCLPRRIGKSIDQSWNATVKSGPLHVSSSCLHWIDRSYTPELLTTFLHELYVSKNCALRRTCLNEIRNVDFNTLVNVVFGGAVAIVVVAIILIAICQYFVYS